MKAERPNKKPRTPNAKLKQAREQRNWTHRDVAENIRLGDNSTVSRWERGINFPSPNHRRELLSLFNMEPEELGFTKPPVQAPALVIPQSDNSRRKPIYTIPHNIPPCVGREEEIAHVCELLQQSSVRLITLVGPGGIGKTYLAIELAASFIKFLPPHELAERLSQLLTTLKNTTLPERHQTLDNAIKWSYDLLNTQEKWLFRQISVFAGGTSLKTIESILETGEQPTLNILDCVNSLINKSLLYGNCCPENKFSRITMLETTRDFAINCLRDTNELELISSLHAMYYLDMVEEAAPALKKPQQDKQLQIFKSEEANLRGALKWLIDHKETVAALRFCEAFGKFCGLYGYWSEEQRWLQAALKLPQIPEGKAIRAKVLRRAGHLAYRLRNFTTAETLFKESVTISRDIEDKQNLAGALSGLGWVLYKQNKKDDAHLYLQESVEAARMSGDAWTIANTLDSWGRYAHDRGNISEASDYLQESVTIARDLQDKETEVRILRTLVTMEIQQKHEAQAIELARESSDLAKQLGTTPIIALSLDILGDVALFKKEYEQAKCHFEKSIALARDLGDEPAAASRYLKLVEIALCQEDTQTILTFLQNSSKLFQKVYDIPAMAAMQIRCQKYIEEKKKSGSPT